MGAVVVILAAGCATTSVASNATGSGSPARSPGAQPSLIGRVWQLLSYTDPSAATSTPVTIDATLSFDRKGYSAHACNYIGVPAKVGATTVTFGQSTETLIGCPAALGPSTTRSRAR